MLYYLLPNLLDDEPAKMAFRLVEQLHALGAGAVMVTENGDAPARLLTRAPVVSRPWFRERARARDTAVCCDPAGLDTARGQGCRLLWHHTDFVPEPLDGLDQWAPVGGPGLANCGAAVSRHVTYRGGDKFEDIAGVHRASCGACYDPCEEAAPGVEYLYLDGVHEAEAADKLRLASLYIDATVAGSAGLRALEAMAAGCVVLLPREAVAPPWLQHGENAWLAASPEALPDVLPWLLEPEQARLRYHLRAGARATAARFTVANHREQLRRLLNGPFAHLWS